MGFGSFAKRMGGGGGGKNYPTPITIELKELESYYLWKFLQPCNFQKNI